MEETLMGVKILILNEAKRIYDEQSRSMSTRVPFSFLRFHFTKKNRAG